MAKVPKEELIKALQYLELEVPESLSKGLDSETIEGSEQDGGGSEANDLEKKKSELQSKISKAKKEQEDLEEELEKCSVPGTMKKSKEEATDPIPEEPKEEKPKEDLEKSEKFEALEKTVGSLVTLVKSQHSTIETLSEQIEEVLQAPAERRSASNLEQLKKSMGFNSLEDQSQVQENGMKKVSIFEKSKVSNILMSIYTEGGSSDNELGQAIMTYEASGHLGQSTLDLVKGKGIEIIK